MRDHVLVQAFGIVHADVNARDVSTILPHDFLNVNDADHEPREPVILHLGLDPRVQKLDLRRDRHVFR